MTTVTVVLPEDEYNFIVKFDPDRDRTANRRELVQVLEHIQDTIQAGRVQSDG